MMAGRSAPHRGGDGRARRSLHSGIRPALQAGYPTPVSHITRPSLTRLDKPGYLQG